MNKPLLALTLGLALPAAAPSFAQTAVPSLEAAPVQTAPVQAAPSIPAWLSERGVTTLDELLATANVQATPEQRARLQRALAERNAALLQANARLSQTMRDTFALSTQQLETGASQAAQDAKERRELDKIRRFQPMRYYEMKRRYDEKMKRRARQAQPAPAQPAPPTTPPAR